MLEFDWLAPPSFNIQSRRGQLLRVTMKKVWDFLAKHEFWFSCLVIIGLYLAEDQTGEMRMGNLALVMFLIAGIRLAMHPMWKKSKD